MKSPHIILISGVRLMKNKALSEVGIALLLKDFCSNCPKRRSCNSKKCRVVEFAEYLIDRGFEKEYLFK
jgi:hypothetical protein